MNDAPEFQPYGLPHLTVIFITIVLPFALAALVRRTKLQRIERVIIVALSAVLILNYLAYLVFIRGLAARCKPSLRPPCLMVSRTGDSSVFSRRTAASLLAWFS